MEKQINCPFCLDTKKHLYFNEAKGVYYCQHCNRGGSIRELPESLNLGHPGALQGQNLRVLPKKYDEIELVRLISMIHIDLRAMAVYQYCLNRLDERIIERQIWWSPDLPYRAMFPVWDGGKLVMWQGRTIEDVKPKYFTWGKCSYYLYNFEEIKDDWAVLTEGPFSCLSTPNGIASFGKHLSSVQFAMVISRFNRLGWAFDPDTRQDRKVLEIKEDLKRFIEVVDIPLPDNNDPNNLGIDKMKELVYNALGEKIGDKDNIIL